MDSSGLPSSAETEPTAATTTSEPASAASIFHGSWSGDPLGPDANATGYKVKLSYVVQQPTVSFDTADAGPGLVDVTVTYPTDLLIANKTPERNLTLGFTYEVLVGWPAGSKVCIDISDADCYLIVGFPTQETVPDGDVSLHLGIGESAPAVGFPSTSAISFGADEKDKAAIRKELQHPAWVAVVDNHGGIVGPGTVGGRTNVVARSAGAPKDGIDLSDDFAEVVSRIATAG